MVEISRQEIAVQIEKLLAGQITSEDIGWWAYDILVDESTVYEAGHEKLLEDVLRSLHYFHDNEPFMQQFYPEREEISYYLKCLKGEELYQRSKVVHWRV